jgi:hypothetical protein
MTEDARDQTGERMNDPEGPDTPHGKLPPPLDEETDEEKEEAAHPSR